MATTSSATVSSTPIIDAIDQVNGLGMINITQQLIDANPNISNPFLIWQDFGTFTPNSTVGLKPGNLVKRALQKRGYTYSSIYSNLGGGYERYNLGAYYVTDIYFSITSSHFEVDALVINNDYYAACTGYSGYLSSNCYYISSCSCINAYSCTKTCSGLDAYKSYSILFLRYGYQTTTISGTYGYTSSTATSNDISGAANALIYGGLTYYLVSILVPIVVLGVIIGACCWSCARNRRQQGVVVVQQPQPMMQQPTAPVYIQNPGYTYPVTQQGYTGLPYYEQQGRDKQNQPYQEPRRNIDRTKPLDQSDYQ
jgi:hypothetical protein